MCNYKGRIMKKVFFYMVAVVLVYSSCGARDFIVEFVEESYKETQVPYSHVPMIYHSIQVRSDAGPKLLILVGDDLNYRKWLRHYISAGKTFIARIAEDENDRFIASKAYEIDVTNIHPFNGGKWSPGTGAIDKDTEGKDIPPAHILHGDKHILVIDTNTKRSRLITSVINRMGYTAMVSHNGNQALSTFSIQPEKFKMIITNHDMPGMKTEQFVDHVLKIDHQIPILVETGYNNPTAKKRFISKFSGAGTVMVKPVVLDDLQKTIKQLVKGDS